MPPATKRELIDAARKVVLAADLALDTDRVDYDADGNLVNSQVDVPLTLGVIDELRDAIGEREAIRLPKIDRCTGCVLNDGEDNPAGTVACSNCLLRLGGGS